jgi:hypothetical protein
MHFLVPDSTGNNEQSEISALPLLSLLYTTENALQHFDRSWFRNLTASEPQQRAATARSGLGTVANHTTKTLKYCGYLLICFSSVLTENAGFLTYFAV